MGRVRGEGGSLAGPPAIAFTSATQGASGAMADSPAACPFIVSTFFQLCWRESGPLSRVRVLHWAWVCPKGASHSRGDNGTLCGRPLERLAVSSGASCCALRGAAADPERRTGHSAPRRGETGQPAGSVFVRQRHQAPCSCCRAFSSTLPTGARCVAGQVRHASPPAAALAVQSALPVPRTSRKAGCN